jgi:LmbE family N-acetylglucosaminyl deacetylase
MEPGALAVTRKAEQNAAAQVLGVKEVVYLDYEDGTLEPTLALRRDLTRAIRRYLPDVVVCSDPTMRFYGDGYLNHPDHRAAGDAALDAVFPSAGTRYIFPELLVEGLEPHDVKEVYVHGHPTPNHWIDISDTIGVKIAALEQHKSQVGGWEGLAEGIRDWAQEAGAGQGMAYAESFKRIVLG